MLEAQTLLLHMEHSHRAARCAPALSRTAGVEDLEVAVAFVQGHVTVAEEDGVGVWESSAQPLDPTAGGTGVVQNREHSVAQRQLERLGQRRSQDLFVDVAVDRVDDGTKRFELFQDRRGDEVTSVDQSLGPRDQLSASLR